MAVLTAMLETIPLVPKTCTSTPTAHGSRRPTTPPCLLRPGAARVAGSRRGVLLSGLAGAGGVGDRGPGQGFPSQEARRYNRAHTRGWLLHTPRSGVNTPACQTTRLRYCLLRALPYQATATGVDADRPATLVSSPWPHAIPVYSSGVPHRLGPAPACLSLAIGRLRPVTHARSPTL
jgi:hypothetical protein